MIVTLADIRRVGIANGWKVLCVPGLKDYFLLRGMDWESVVRNGIELEEFKKIEHPLVKAVVAAVEEQNGRR